MKKILLFSAILFTVGSLMSCKKDFDPGTTSGNKLGNGWWCTLTLGGADVYKVGTYFLNTYNTADNKDSIWIDDLKGGYGFKCKAAANFSNLTFSTPGSANEYYVGTTAFPASVNIVSGKVLPRAGHSLAGNVTDSIFIKAVFSDDLVDTFIVAGTARTGLVEDDY